MVSWIDLPTYSGGHILDTVLSKKDSKFQRDYKVRDIGLSDHFFVDVTLNLLKPEPGKKTIYYRKLNEISLQSLNNDISDSFKLETDITTATQTYNEVLTTILDKHALELKKELTARPNTKWYNQNIRKAKVIRAHGLNTHSYADDSQLYLTFHSQELNSELARIETCLVRK